MEEAEEEQWLDERQDEVYEYLKREGVTHGRVEEWPSWYVTPYVSVWAIESAKEPETVGWWVICGDLPTDYISSTDIENPREAVSEFAKRWIEVAEYMSKGKLHPTIKIGNPDNYHELGPLLISRAETLNKWVKDDSNWL